ncbi:Feruloyl CoA ortho-hydroxylase 2 [Hibiscus syriacus]|uniref:Feruloyl CoA ortho-hydroxylase 2 n=1 Tax=Hibiscus syriacus TaxID=106335 RepID=A0A6A2ZIX5_HIBSY|nr:feruloyl CoA ortho-hydroxylase F6H1-3-like [Hibiscus syriacus]KAE8691653.1 Feruloyl CoA ortho-hydroxylase 2 [Hibiscus syriacus]
MPPRHLHSEKIFDFVVNKGNGIKGLVDAGIETVPELYILPTGERLEPNNILPHESIPVIDVSNWDDPKVTESICEAAGKWGFFQITNHGVPLEVLDAVKEAAHRFFGLPYEERNKYWAGNSPTDTVALKTSFVPQAEDVLEWRDFLSFRCGPRDLESFPSWPPVCREEVIKYMQSAKPVIRKLLDVLLKGLNVKEIDKTREHALMSAPVVYFNYYPRCPNPDLSAGVLPHSDITTISLLLQDDNGGLYVRATDDDDNWIHVPPINGALVINIGDVLQIMSNDSYKSIEHRVVANGSKDRVSVPIFMNPRPDAVFGPLSEVLESGEQPLYKEVFFSDYFRHHLSKKHEGKKTMDFARI